jgi:hypothetical protein
MAYTTAQGKVHWIQGNVTTAQANAGVVIVPARPGKAIAVVAATMIARGGAAATCTSVDLKDTAGTPVVALAFAQASLTENTALHDWASAGVTLTTYRSALTVEKGLQILKTGSSIATATSFDYAVGYCYV